MWLHPTLPTAVDLARYAAQCSKPAFLWLLGPDLVIRAVAGQLAPLVSPCPVGRHMAHLNTDGAHLRLRAAIRALLGESVLYDVTCYGRAWRVTMMPIMAPDGILGALGCATLAEEAAGEGTDETLGHPFAFVRDTPDGRTGDLVTVRPGIGGGIWRHGRLAQADFDRHIATGALVPIPTSDAAAPPAAPASSPAPAPRAPGGGPLRRRLHLA